MNPDIVNKYKITLSKKLIAFPNAGAEFFKVINTNNIYLTDFLLEWNAEEIKEYLIPEIDKVLKGIKPDFETGSEKISMIVGPINTVFFIDNVGTNYPEIPTVDFKEIVFGWKEYLES